MAKPSVEDNTYDHENVVDNCEEDDCEKDEAFNHIHPGNKVCLPDVIYGDVW